MSFVEGWAHYCEQMMVEAGFRRGDTTFRLGQLAEALVRLARFVVGIRLHCEDLSVEQGMRFFRDEAFLEEANARREAERGTFDPELSGVLGRQADDAEASARLQGTAGQASSRLRAFHDAVLAQGSAPFWAHRRLLLDETADASWNNGLAAMPLYEYQCDACGQRFEVIQKFSGPPRPSCAALRQGPGSPADVVAGDSVQGDRLVHHRLRAEGQVGADRQPAREKSGDRRTSEAGRQLERRATSPSEDSDTPTPSASTQSADDVSRRQKRLTALVRADLQIERLEIPAKRLREIRAAAARNRRAPSGTRACCRCRAGRRAISHA